MCIIFSAFKSYVYIAYLFYPSENLQGGDTNTTTRSTNDPRADIVTGAPSRSKHKTTLRGGTLS